MTTALETTIKEITGMTTGELREWAKTGPLQQATADEVTEAVRLINRIEEDLQHQIATARRDLDLASADLAAGHHINESGILQSTGTKIEMLAARRKDAYSRLNSTGRMVTAITAATAT